MDMKVRRITAISLIIALAMLVGCADKKYPENAIALVNGKIITEQEIEKGITERKMSVAIGEKIRSLEPNSLTSKEALIQSLNIPEDELNPEQIRYLESRERSTTKLLSNNEAFNILLREEVFYQEAVKQGHEVSVDKAKQILEESNKVSNEALSGDEEALRKQNEIIKYSNEIYKQYGFKSEFNKVMADKLPQSDSYQQSIDTSNTWDDYGEFLLDKAKIKVLNTEYGVELYGKPWSYGLLDLK
jgi:hypothetical protein